MKTKALLSPSLWGSAGVGLLLLASCSDAMEDARTFLNGESKTPITMQTNLSATPLTRAFDKTFEKNDLLYAYIEAGNTTGDVFTYEGQFMWKGNFTIGATVDNGGTPGGTGLITTSENLSPTLYWDDFSSVEYDLREAGRGIRLKYGYCYNGGETNASDKNEVDGTLIWTIPNDQSTTGGAVMKQADLLYAATQPMITYGHDPASRGTLTLPYTHAMSKITVNVTTGEGYAANKANFATSVLTLKDMQVKANVNAPAAEVTAVDASIADVTTYTNSKANTTATYQAIVGPTRLSTRNLLATITNIDGNDYNIPLTDGILTAWSAEDKLVVVEEDIQDGICEARPTTKTGPNIGKDYITKPGIHYILDVTVDKQKITIRATITDWESVKADGKAAINFAGDVTEKGSIAEELKAKGFDVYKSSSASSFAEKSTSVTYTAGKWNYSPVIYWNGQSDASYFRAISPTGVSASVLAQGTDLMWGTSGNDAINPRTGDVALDFQHLMSKLCVKLETTSDAAAVNLDGATISITNLATTGSYNIVDATVGAGTAVETMLSDKASGFIEYVVPQTIGNDAMVVITLADGTTYSLQLNKCTEEGGSAVTLWTKGKSYTYTIHLEKETQTFRALVKNWEESTGSGDATLDWD